MVKQVIFRWLYLIFLSFIAILLCLSLLQTWIYQLMQKVNEFSLTYHWIVSLIFAILSSTLFWIILIKLGGLSLRTFISKQNLYNPPVWIFGIISFIGYYLVESFLKKDLQESDIEFSTVGLSIGIFVISSIFAVFFNFIFYEYRSQTINHKRLIRNESENIKQIIEDPDQLISWIHKEEPIENPFDDLFDMKIFARRITHILINIPIKTIGLVGPYGCGKSSILKMVDHYIDNPKNFFNDSHIYKSQDKGHYPLEYIITCWVSGWGFREGTAAEHILQQAIKKLGKYTDCLSVTNLPGMYKKAIGDSGNILARIISSLLCGWQSPHDILDKLDSLLGRINRRMVIFLEDIDRNRRSDVFFNEITALLDGLKGLQNLTFVLAIGEEHKGQEVMIKTAEHLETIPSVDRKSVVKMCEIFRDRCSSFLGEKIKLISDEDKDKRMGIGRLDAITSMAKVHKEMQAPIDYIAMLLNNPRVAKNALRRTYQTWEKLSGEIDFDDLFIANVLRTSAPEIFMFINQNIAAFQYLASGSEHAQKESNKNEEDLSKGLEECSKGAEWNFEAANELVNCIFPGWYEPGPFRYTELRESSRNYQYVENSRPTDYWARIMREELSVDEVSDQEILIALNEWNKDRQKKAFRNMNMQEALLSSKEVLNKVQQFKKFIEPETLRALAQEQFQITLAEKKNKASRENCPAISEWFLLTPDELVLNTEDWHNWLFEQIKTSLPVSLRYANDLYHFWLDSKRYSTLKLRSKIIEEAKQIYGTNPEVLIEAIDPNCSSVTHFARELSDENLGGQGFTPEEWQWLGDVLFKAVKINQQIIIPQIVILIGNFESHRDPRSEQIYKYELQTDIAKGIFGNNFKQLMHLLTEDIDLSIYADDIKNYVQLCQNCAKKWIADQGNGIVS